MANFVTKKDGTKVPFDGEKIKSAVNGAAMESGLSDEEGKKVAEETLSLVATAFEGQEEVSAQEIREKVLSELDASAPAVAERAGT